MFNELPYKKMLEESLRGELRVLNAHLPRKQRPLSELLGEKYPCVVCNDGSTHLFKMKELEYLASIIAPDEQETLLLPMLIRLGPNQGEIGIICERGIEEKIVSRVVNMSVICRQRVITIYKPQLSTLRKVLKTTMQYVFSP